eukprot:7379761-Prymnesium_polylepis.5
MGSDATVGSAASSESVTPFVAWPMIAACSGIHSRNLFFSRRAPGCALRIAATTSADAHSIAAKWSGMPKTFSSFAASGCARSSASTTASDARNTRARWIGSHTPSMASNICRVIAPSRKRTTPSTCVARLGSERPAITAFSEAASGCASSSARMTASDTGSLASARCSGCLPTCAERRRAAHHKSHNKLEQQCVIAALPADHRWSSSSKDGNGRQGRSERTHLVTCCRKLCGDLTQNLLLRAAQQMRR